MTVLRDWSRPFAVGAALSAAATLFTLNVLDPDAFVARVNVARAKDAAPSSSVVLDIAHLATLSGGAVPQAVAAVLAPRAAPMPPADYDRERCAAAERLLSHYGPSRSPHAALPTDVAAAWRFWNADDAKAVSVVREHARELFAAAHASCTAAKRAAQATQRS